MKEKKTIFQLIVAGIFGVLFLVGFAMFATYKGSEDKDKIEIGKVKIWGTIDRRIMNELITEIADRNQNFINVKYVEKSKKSFNDDILEALATQNAPDLILLSNENFLKNKNKIHTIPYTNFDQRSFLDTFIDAFDVYINKDGILGIPFAIDPMVLYYNKTLFASNRIVLPPKKWNELETPGGAFSRLNTIDNNNNILKSSIAFGESQNIKHSKEILYTLFFQNGNPIFENSGDKIYTSNKFYDKGSVIKFYTQFSDNTNKITYSWNKSKNNSFDEFIFGNLGMYIGFISELVSIKNKNPNLNFSIAEMPTFLNTKVNRVYAKTWVLVIPKMSKNKIGAFYTALKFTENKVQKQLTDMIFLPPVRRDMLAGSPDNAFLDIFYKEAIYGQTILDPNISKTDNIFDDFVNNVNTNLRSPISATQILQQKLSDLLKKFQ